MSSSSPVPDLSRRRFLQLGCTGLACAGAAGLLMPAPALAGLGGWKGMKEIALRNLHTDEKLRITFWKNGSFDRSAMAKINHILRDYRTGDVYPMDANLIELLHDLQNRLRTDAPVEIISGYRSPQTNARLSDRSDGVAKNSLHTKGLAIDIRMPGTSLRRLRTEALLLRRGGVGFYPKSDFVHLDTGRFRFW